jgi:hypothetical protein
MASIQKAGDRPNWRCAFTDALGRPQQISTGVPVKPGPGPRGKPDKRNQKVAQWFADGVERVVNEINHGGFTAAKLRKRVEEFATQIGFVTGTRIEPKTVQEWLSQWLKEQPEFAQTQIALLDTDNQERRYVVEFFKTALTQVTAAAGVEVKGCSVEQFFKDWGDAVAKDPNMAPGTKRRYAEVTRSFLKDLGRVKARSLEALSSEHIQTYRDGLKKRGFSATTINLHLKII